MAKAKHAHPPLSNVLASRIQTLQDLLKRLPESLPLNPAETTYQFFIDPDDLEEGKEYALRRRLELAFPDTWQRDTSRSRAIRIRERGRRLDTDLIKFLRENLRDIPEAERGLFQDIWVDRLILAAKEAGAKPRKRAVADTDDEGDAPVAGMGLTCKRPKQTTLTAHLSTSNVDKHPGITLPSATTRETQQSDVLEAIVISDTDDEDYDPEQEETAIPRRASLATASKEAAKPPRRRPRALSPSPSPSNPSEAINQRTLFDMGCKPCTPDEAAVQRKEVDRKLARLGAADRQRALERAREVEEEKKERERTLNRDRQRKFRERRAEEKRLAGGQAGKKAKLAVLGYASDTPIAEVAGVSRPEGQAWRKRRPGTQGGKKATPATRTNYYHPFLWSHIDRAGRRTQFSAARTVKFLQREHPQLFQKLNKGTVQRWISKSKNGWSKRTRENVERRHALAGSGRAGFLTPHPTLVDSIKTKLQEIRKSGIVVGRLLARSIIISIIHAEKPELLRDFKVSEEWVGAFLQSVMNWTLRHGTRAAAHIPDNAGELCERTVFRAVHLINFYDICADLVINMDQTGVLTLLSGGGRTFDEKGKRQIDVVGKDEKRAYTLCVGSVCGGRPLPFQSVWPGTSTRSLPHLDAPGMTEALANGFDFSYADSPKKTSHFSTLSTMHRYLEYVVQP